MSLIDVVINVLDHPVVPRLAPLAQSWFQQQGAAQTRDMDDQAHSQIIKVMETASGATVVDAEVRTTTSTQAPITKNDDLYTADNRYDTGCAVCGKAHLAATAGMMDRAAALAQERDTCDADCTYYVAAAQREVVNLTGYDWTPDLIAKTSEHERAVLEKWSPEVDKLQPVLFQGPEMQSRINLAKAAGALEEAGRFARADGVNHPEAQRRIADAEALLAETERGEWSPERRQRMDATTRSIVDPALPAFRRQRQFLLNGIESPEDLDRVAAEVGTLNAQMQTVAVAQLTPEQIQEMASATQQVRQGFRQDLQSTKGGTPHA